MTILWLFDDCVGKECHKNYMSPITAHFGANHTQLTPSLDPEVP